jgi:RNA polymerase sigma-70 factor (ECF subfamily)
MSSAAARAADSVEVNHDDVVARVRAGDERALETIFRAHYAQLCGFALRYVRERALAEEIVQDLFADLWERRAQWRLMGSLRAYLFSAVRNRALNLRKRQTMERDWERDEAADGSLAFHHVPERADEGLEREEIGARVRTAVESLPERCRIIMHLRWRDQLRHAEIAAIMGISVKGVEMQLTRGLRALRVLLGS